MYNIGDAIILASGGVWRVVAASDAGLTVQLHASDETKQIVHDDADIVRAIADKETILAIIERIGFVRTIQAPNEKLRKEFYQSAMDEYDELEWVRVIKSAYLREQEQKAQAYEKKLGKLAKAFFHSEVSLALDIPYSQVEQYIAEAVTADSW